MRRYFIIYLVHVLLLQRQRVFHRYAFAFLLASSSPSSPFGSEWSLPYFSEGQRYSSLSKVERALHFVDLPRRDPVRPQIPELSAINQQTPRCHPYMCFAVLDCTFHGKGGATPQTHSR